MKSILLIDLEKTSIQIDLLRSYIENDQLIYVFNLRDKLTCNLQALTELASWVSSGQLVVLDTPTHTAKSSAYALLAGQLLALLDPEASIELQSKHSAANELAELLRAAGKTVVTQDTARLEANSSAMPAAHTVAEQPALLQIKRYCDAIGQAPDRLPLTMDALKNSIANILKLSADQVPQVLALLVSLKLIKRDQGQVRFRKKMLKQWIALELASSTKTQPPAVQPKKSQAHSAMPQVVVGDVDTIMQFLKEQQAPAEGPFPPSLDELQWQALQKLHELKLARPKDIFSLRDMLQDWFPKANIHHLLKGLMDKGYIQLDDDQLHYTAQTFIH
ncbi:hypothetical protein [uncultured Acinetobacter sp.]|uniref:hypothetical protein n=1 Tax=uncultured Acinetobacter sp. TaxID=165433 RepID=UPI00259099C0|nr:hypothetical protein [uncultured Acinetobacter sp.]